MSRPEFWMVSLLPMYVGWLLASRELFPGMRSWAAFFGRATHGGETLEDFLIQVFSALTLGGPFLLAALALGPLLWLATLLINDVHDLDGDRRNARKARIPLVQGLVSAGQAKVTAYAAAAAAVAAGWAVRPAFAVFVLANVVLAWLYSVPPVRLKTRPGADVAVNAVGIGLISMLAGWAVVRSVADFPWIIGLQAVLVAAAIYVPTTLVDRAADEAAGYLTLATHLGEAAAARIGMACWAAANVGALALSWADVVLPRRMFPLLVLFVPVLLFEYQMLIVRTTEPAARVRGIAVTSLTFLAVNLAFALMYTGVWVA